MLPKLASILTLFIIFISALPGFTAEGMWLLDNLNQLPWAEMTAKGLILNPEQIYNPNGTALSDAIVQLGGGTGSFVSGNGLILTNHHVAFGAIQSQSSAQTDYIRQGFLATTRAEELPATGYKARITLGFKDVTAKVLSAVNNKMSYGERYDALEKRKLQLVKEAEQQGDVVANVLEMLSGSQYYLFTYLELRDIRIVYVPPRSVGEYGGDIDNWIWPRHTGDFSFMRAYIGPSGKPADYATDNVPFKPKTYLKIATAGIQEGDFTMVLGYPGNTFRYRSSYSIDLWENCTYPDQIDVFKVLIKTYEDVAGSDRELQIRFADQIKGLNNVLKNNQGMLEGLRKSQLLERKRKQEAGLTQFLKNHPDLEKKYGQVLPEIGEQYRELRTYHRKQIAIQNFLNANLVNFGYFISKWSIEKSKNEMDRESGFDNRSVERVKEGFKLAQQDLYIPADKKVLEMMMLWSLNLPDDQKIAVVERIVTGKTGNDARQAIQDYVEKLYAGTRLGSLEDRMKMFDLSASELAKMNDSMLQFAAEVENELQPINKKYNAFVGAVFKLRPQLILAYYEQKKSALYPDANGTIRFTYGYVKGYSPADAVYYDWKTTLKGVIEKDTGQEPFDNPKKLAEIYQNNDFGRYYDGRIKGVPVNFTHDVDTTGGNSGSPVLNGRGEVIGLVFDGNYESMSSGFQFDPAITRSISVDIRYVLFITEKLGQATNVLSELNL